MSSTAAMSGAGFGAGAGLPVGMCQSFLGSAPRLARSKDTMRCCANAAIASLRTLFSSLTGIISPSSISDDKCTIVKAVVPSRLICFFTVSSVSGRFFAGSAIYAVSAQTVLPLSSVSTRRNGFPIRASTRAQTGIF